VAGYEDGFCVSCSKLFAGLGGTRLEDHWCSLRGWLADVRSGNIVVFTNMIDGPDKSWIGIDNLFAVELDGVIPPGRLPKFVHHFDIFFSHGIAIVVLWLFSATKVSGCGIEVTGDDLS
jgi:hypothetical protein